MTVQKLKPTIDSEFEAARRYFSMVAAINDIHITPIELKLLAFMAVKGSISNTNNKDVFCETFQSSKASVYNIIGSLSEKGLLHKIDNKVKIIPSIALNFKEPVVVKITFDAETK